MFVGLPVWFGLTPDSRLGHQVVAPVQPDWGKMRFLALILIWAMKWPQYSQSGEKYAFWPQILGWATKWPKYSMTGEKCIFWPQILSWLTKWPQ